MEYKIISTDSIPGTIEAVNNHIKQGWEPLGGVCADKMNHFAQAMIRTQPEPAKKIKEAKAK